MSKGRPAASRSMVYVLLGFAVFVVLAAFAAAPLFGRWLDAADKWASVASAGLAAVSLFTAWRLRPAASEGPAAPKNPGAACGAVVATASLAPVAVDVPRLVRGRDGHLRRLRRAARRPGGRVQVLTGLGGVGKSTLAVEMCRLFARRGGRTPWWVSASDPASLTEGLVSLAEELGAHQAHLTAIRSQSPRARERLWDLLGTARPGWLLVFDNVDDPETVRALVGSGLAGCAGRGLVLVTSRIGQRGLWGDDAEVNEVDVLAEDDAAQVLLDMAPHAGDRAGARALVRELGCLPLAVQIAGTNLASRFSLWDSFDDYRAALGDLGPGRVLTAGRRIGHAVEHRRNVMLTWELSLTALAGSGLPQCGVLLRLLSQFSATAPIPASLLHTEPIRALVGPDGSLDTLDLRRLVQEGLQGLADQCLVAEAHIADVAPPEPAFTLHPVVAETNRAGTDDATVPHTAVELVAAAVAPLRYDDDRDWRRVALLAPHVEELLKHAAARLDRDHLGRLATATAHVVASYAWSGSEEGAEAIADRALERCDPLGRTHPAVLRLRNERAWAIGRHGHWTQARTELAEVYEARRQHLGAEHPETLDTRHKLAWATGKLGDWETARAELRVVLRARVRILGEEHPDVLHSRCCLAWATGRCGELAEAEAAYEAVIAARTRRFGADHSETLDARDSLAELYATCGRFDDAERMLRALVADRVRVLGARHPETLESRPRYWLAYALAGQGRLRQAGHLLRQLLDDQIQDVGPHHPATEASRQLLRKVTADR